MPQTHTPPRIEEIQRAIALVEQLPADKFTIALNFLEQLTQTPNETSLMQIIQQQPTIVHEVSLKGNRPRLEELRDRCEYGHLSSEEHQELMQYEDELERHNVDRLWTRYDRCPKVKSS